MSTISDIKGSLATPDMINMIKTLYSNVPLIEKITIKIQGNEVLVKGFLDYVADYDPRNIGCNKIIWLYDTDHKSHTIETSDYEDELHEILLNYI